MAETGLDPVLQALKEKRLPGCTVVCSVRDILVEKEKELTEQ